MVSGLWRRYEALVWPALERDPLHYRRTVANTCAPRPSARLRGRPTTTPRARRRRETESIVVVEVGVLVPRTVARLLDTLLDRPVDGSGLEPAHQSVHKGWERGLCEVQLHHRLPGPRLRTRRQLARLPHGRQLVSNRRRVRQRLHGCRPDAGGLE